MRLGVPSRQHLYQILTPSQLREWERLLVDEPFAADSVEETLSRGFAVMVNMLATKEGPQAIPNHFRAIPRGKRGKAKPKESTIADLISSLGG